MAKPSIVDRDTSIKAYGTKRNFSVTPEPPAQPGGAGGTAPIFIVQKHAAHRAGLHWDFRLEHGGVLWSWAVPNADSNDAVQAYRTEGVHPFQSDAVHRSEVMASRWYRLGKSIWLMS
jgi:DNA polymerase Ligase (LigD)